MNEIEKQAEEYVNKNPRAKILYSFEEDRILQIKKAFQNGVKWGKEHAIEWHDLRKDPNDLPKGNELCSAPVYIVSKHGNSDLAQYDYSLKSWYYKYSYEHILYDVIAWCEQPQFKDKEQKK